MGVASGPRYQAAGEHAIEGNVVGRWSRRWAEARKSNHDPAHPGDAERQRSFTTTSTANLKAAAATADQFGVAGRADLSSRAW